MSTTSTALLKNRSRRHRQSAGNEMNESSMDGWMDGSDGDGSHSLLPRPLELRASKMRRWRRVVEKMLLGKSRYSNQCAMCSVQFHNIDEYPAFTDVGDCQVVRKKQEIQICEGRIEFQATVPYSPANAVRLPTSTRLPPELAWPPHAELNEFESPPALFCFCKLPDSDSAIGISFHFNSSYFDEYCLC